MKDFEKVMEIMEEETENQPQASKETRNGYSSLCDDLEDYVTAVQRDAFYFGYITALKHMEGK